MGVLQAILNFVDFGMTPQEAVLAPRFSATSDTILVTARIPRYRYRELESAGYSFKRSPYSYQVASVHAIGFDERGERRARRTFPTATAWRCAWTELTPCAGAQARGG